MSCFVETFVIHYLFCKHFITNFNFRFVILFVFKLTKNNKRNFIYYVLCKTLIVKSIYTIGLKKVENHLKVFLKR